jgi:hypothetical protein
MKEATSFFLFFSFLFYGSSFGMLSYCLQSILNIHMSFYKDLSDLNEKWPYVDAVGDVMMKFLPSLKAYEPYALNFKHAMYDDDDDDSLCSVELPDSWQALT